MITYLFFKTSHFLASSYQPEVPGKTEFHHLVLEKPHTYLCISVYIRVYPCISDWTRSRLMFVDSHPGAALRPAWEGGLGWALHFWPVTAFTQSWLCSRFLFWWESRKLLCLGNGISKPTLAWIVLWEDSQDPVYGRPWLRFLIVNDTVRHTRKVRRDWGARIFI